MNNKLTVLILLVLRVTSSKVEIDCLTNGKFTYLGGILSTEKQTEAVAVLGNKIFLVIYDTILLT